MQMPAVSPVPPAARRVAAGRGLDWIAEGFDLFRQRPGVWIGVLLIWLVISIVLGAMQLSFVGSFLNPIFEAGIMLGCASLARGEGLRVEHLFAGFRSGRVGALLMLTVWTIVLALAALAVVGVTIGLPMLGALKDLDHPSAREVVSAVGVTGVLLLALGALAVGLLLAMATWFAPPLIVFRGVPALEAIKLSFFACLTNWLALLVYGLVTLVVLIVACLPLMLGLLIAIPVLVASIYTAYRDLFPERAAAPQ